MGYIPESVIWATFGLYAVIFIAANQQLYVAPGWQSKDILRLRMGITFALFLELLLPSLELLVRYVPAVSSFTNMIPTLVFWVLLLVLSYALHKSIRVSREQDDKKWARHLHRLWVAISVLNAVCWFLGILTCFAAFVFFPRYIIVVTNVYYIGFNLYAICGASNTLLIAYRLSISLKRIPSMTRGNNPSLDPVPTLATQSGDSSKAATTPSTAKRIVAASVFISLILAALALATIYSITTTLMWVGPFGKMDTLMFHVIFTSLFTLSLIVYHWYTPVPSASPRADGDEEDHDTANKGALANGSKPTLSGLTQEYMQQMYDNLSPTMDANATPRPKHYPEITPMDSYHLGKLPKMSDVTSIRSGHSDL